MPECFAHFQGEIPRQLFLHHFQPAIVRHLKYICNGVLRSSGVLKTQLVKVTWVQPTISLRLLGKINDAPAVVNVATGGSFFSFFFFFSWSSEMGLWTERCGCVRHMDSSVGELCGRCPRTSPNCCCSPPRHRVSGSFWYSEGWQGAEKCAEFDIPAFSLTYSTI